MVSEEPSTPERLHELESEVAHLRRTDSLGDVATMLFGELRCLMAPVSIGNELLAKRLSRDVELGKLASHAASAAALASKLLRDTLDFVHQPAPRDPRAVPVAEVIAGLRGLLDGLLGQGIELVIELEHAVVRVDRFSLERALLNMVCHVREESHGLNRVTLATRAMLLDDERAARFGCPGPGRYVLLRVTSRTAGGAVPPPTQRDDGASNRVRKLARERGWGFSASQEAGQMPAISVYLPEER